MTKFRPFRGMLYNEPGSNPDHGVLDISSVLGQSVDPATVEDNLDSGFFIQEADRSFYMYRAGWMDKNGRSYQASGVFGLVDPKPGQFLWEPVVLRLDNPEFDYLLTPDGLPLVRATADTGIHYRLWPIRRAGVIETIAAALSRIDSDASGLVVATNDDLDPPTGLVFGHSTK